MPPPFIDPYDDAIQNIVNATAQSRFTKTPINISNPNKVIDLINKNLGFKTDAQSSDFNEVGPRSSYSPETNQISIGLGPNPTYNDFANDLSHENIHAVLKRQPYQLSFQPKDYIKNLARNFFSPLEERALSGFAQGNRAGNANLELPAYMGAFKPGELKGINDDDRMMFLRSFLPTLNDTQRNLLVRIIVNNAAAQGKTNLDELKTKLLATSPQQSLASKSR